MSPLIFYAFVIEILLYFIGYGIGIVCQKSYKRIFRWLQENTADQRYSVLIDRLLNAIERVDVEETREILIDFIYFIQGTTRYRPVQYVGDTYQCPISQDDIRTGDSILILPCGHSGKYEQMKEWVDSHTLCPICRQLC